MTTQPVKTPPIVHLEPYQIDQKSSKCTAVALAILTLMVAGSIATLLAFTGGPTNPMIFGPGIAAITVSLLVVLAIVVRACEPLKEAKRKNVEAQLVLNQPELPPNYPHREDPTSPSRVADKPSQKRGDPTSPPAVNSTDFFSHHAAFSPTPVTLTPEIEPSEITADSIKNWNDDQIIAYLRDIPLSDKLQISYLVLVEKLKDLMPPEICRRFAAAPKLYLALAEQSADFAAVLYEVMKCLNVRKRKQLISESTSNTLRERMVNYQMFIDWEKTDGEQPRFVERLKKMTNLNCFRDYLSYFDTHLETSVRLISPKRQTLRALASPALRKQFSELDESETYSLSSTFSNLLRYQQCIRSFDGDETEAFVLMGRFLKLDEQENLVDALRDMEPGNFQKYVSFVDLRYFSGIDKTRDEAFERILLAVAQVGAEKWPQVTAPCYEQLLIRLFGTGDLTRNKMEPLLNKCEEEAKVRILKALPDNIFYRFTQLGETNLYDHDETTLNRFRDLYPIEQMELLSRLKTKYKESLKLTKRSHIHENVAYACIKKVICLATSPSELLTHIGQTWPQLVAKYMVEKWDPKIGPLIDSIWKAMDTEAKQSFYSAAFASRQKLDTIPQTLLDYSVKFSLNT